MDDPTHFHESQFWDQVTDWLVEKADAAGAAQLEGDAAQGDANS